MVAQAVLVVAAVVGAIIPDLDQPDSLMARKVEFVGGLPIVAMLVALVVTLHKVTSITAWAVVLIMTMLFGTARNITRMVGLGIIGAGLLYLGWHKNIPLTAAFILVLWIVGAMFTKHRTFTHSLPGLILFAVGVQHVATRTQCSPSRHGRGGTHPRIRIAHGSRCDCWGRATSLAVETKRIKQV